MRSSTVFSQKDLNYLYQIKSKVPFKQLSARQPQECESGTFVLLTPYG